MNESHQEGGRRPLGDHQGHHPGAADRPRRPHAAVPALQHPVRLAHPDPADRRLSVRVEIFLRLFEAFDPVQPAALLRPDLGLGAEARRHRRVQAAEGQLDRLHQARHRPAGRPHPGDRRRAPHQRQGSEARAGRGLRDHRRRRPHACGCRSTARRCPNGVAHFIIEREGDRATGTTPASTRSRPATSS